MLMELTMWSVTTIAIRHSQSSQAKSTSYNTRCGELAFGHHDHIFQQTTNHYHRDPRYHMDRSSDSEIACHDFYIASDGPTML